MPLQNLKSLITGEEANNIKHGNSFSEDLFQGKTFPLYDGKSALWGNLEKGQKFHRKRSPKPRRTFLCRHTKSIMMANYCFYNI